MAETKKKETKKTTTKPVKKDTKKTAPKKDTKKVVKKEEPKVTKEDLIKEQELIETETKKLTNEAAFSVWVDILILIFVVLMLAVVLYGYIIAK